MLMPTEPELFLSVVVWLAVLRAARSSTLWSASRLTVLPACTLLPYDPQFELGSTLAEASRPVALNHPHCAAFCVLGGAACSR